MSCDLLVHALFDASILAVKQGLIVPSYGTELDDDNVGGSETDGDGDTSATGGASGAITGVLIALVVVLLLAAYFFCFRRLKRARSDKLEYGNNFGEDPEGNEHNFFNDDNESDGEDEGDNHKSITVI